MIRRWPESQLIILDEPDAQPPVRRASVRRFPYSAYYAVRPDRVEVLACLHACMLAATPIYGGNARRRNPLSNAELPASG